MQRLYVGNLPVNCDNESLRELFQRNGINTLRVHVVPRRRCGFVTCPDQNNADRAIDLLNGSTYLNAVIRIEPSMPNIRATTQSRKESTRVFVRQLPVDVDWTELETLLSKQHPIVSIEKSTASEHPSAIVAYSLPSQARDVAHALNGSKMGEAELRNHVLGEVSWEFITLFLDNHTSNRFVRWLNVTVTTRRVSIYTDRPPNRVHRTNSLGNSTASPTKGPHRQQHPGDLPLRMAVDAKYVGAIIGQGGKNISEISRECKARCVVESQRGIRDGTGAVEKTVSIFGIPENCSKACRRIQELVMREAAAEGQDQGSQQPELRLRVNNSLVGRVIGRHGVFIKAVMQETSTVIFVSNISELNSFNMERTITIRGQDMDTVSAAERRVSAKVRQCFEFDMQKVMQPSHLMYNGMMHPIQMPLALPPGSIDPAYLATSQSPLFYGYQPPMFPGAAQFASENEVVHMFVSASLVGALIGHAGTHIKNIMRISGAKIRVDVPKANESMGAGGDAGPQEPRPESPDTPRKVIITGSEPQQQKAQLWVFQRVAEQCMQYFDEIRLPVEIQVPSSLIGRIIGKSGRNVRELQRITGAQIKLPDQGVGSVLPEGVGDGASPGDGGPPKSPTENGTEDGGVEVMRIVGNYNATQAVQARVRQLVHQMQNPQPQLQPQLMQGPPMIPSTIQMQMPPPGQQPMQHLGAM